MYLTTPPEKLWIVDIEGDLIPSTVVYCVCAKNIGTGEEVRLRDYVDIREWCTSRISDDCRFVGHNFIGYDAPTLNRLVGTKITIGRIIDTMLMSMVYSPSLEGGHGLGDWGRRLGHAKGDFSDFSKYSPEMEEYCMNDVRLNVLLYQVLSERMSSLGFTNVGLDIEHRSWQIIQRQQQNGFPFDIKKAHLLYVELRGIENELLAGIERRWPPELLPVRKFGKARKKDGTFTANYARHIDQYQSVSLDADGGYTGFDYVHFNVGSPAQRVAKLLELGWEPLDDEWTVIKNGTRKGEKGSPTPTKKGQLVPSLQRYVDEGGEGCEEIVLIASWLEYNSRANMINTWIEAYDDTTGCIHGRLWLANTLRYRHSNPNTANIPAVRLSKSEEPLRGVDGVFTYEARDLWTTRDRINRRLVGVDAKGIQLRVLAHHLNNKEFIDAVLNGDPHSYNQEIGGFATRSVAKTFIYAFLLGAGDAKVGVITGGTPKSGKQTKARFIGNFPGLERLLLDLKRQVERTGRVVLCDGTPVLVKQMHTRLGYLLQGDESRIMKKASIYVTEGIRRLGLDAIKCGDIHDEWQYDVKLCDVERFEELCRSSFAKAGHFFNYNLPIECDSKVGLTWAETH